MIVFHDFGNFEIAFIKNYLVVIINLKKKALSLIILNFKRASSKLCRPLITYTNTEFGPRPDSAGRRT